MLTMTSRPLQKIESEYLGLTLAWSSGGNHWTAVAALASLKLIRLDRAALIIYQLL